MKKKNSTWEDWCQAFWDEFGPKKNDMMLIRLFQTGKQHRWKPCLHKRHTRIKGMTFTAF